MDSLYLAYIDDVDGRFHGHFLDFPSLEFSGSSYDDAAANATLVLAQHASTGVDLPKPSTHYVESGTDRIYMIIRCPLSKDSHVKLNITLPQNLVERLAVQCRKGVYPSRSGAIALALEKMLDEL